jgi:hypothetical protein
VCKCAIRRHEWCRSPHGERCQDCIERSQALVAREQSKAGAEIIGVGLHEVKCVCVCRGETRGIGSVSSARPDMRELLDDLNRRG